jgi:hypothetical protein
MTQDPQDAGVHQLPPPKARPPHVFGDPVSVKGDAFRARHPQTERTCAVCRLVKVTVHHPDGRAWREWRLADSSDQYSDDRSPPCTVIGQAAP